jgi:hypothetical protein
MRGFDRNFDHNPHGPIACLAWGSLVWDTRTLPVTGEWETDGPILPLEFARQSGDGRMTLVIVDSDHRVPVLWSKLNVRSLPGASAEPDRPRPGDIYEDKFNGKTPAYVSGWEAHGGGYWNSADPNGCCFSIFSRGRKYGRSY